MALRSYWGELNVTNIDSIYMTGSNTYSQNAVYIQGSEKSSFNNTLNINVKNNFHIGTTTDYTALFAGLHAHGGTLTLNASDVIINNGEGYYAVYCQQTGGSTQGIINVNADKMFLASYYEAISSVIYGNGKDSSKNKAEINLTGNDISILSWGGAGVRLRDGYGDNPHYQGETTVNISGSNSVDITGATYGISIERSATENVTAKVNVNSENGSVSINGDSSAIYSDVDLADAVATVDVSAKNSISLSSKDGFGIKAKNSDITLSAANVKGVTVGQKRLASENFDVITHGFCIVWAKICKVARLAKVNFNGNVLAAKVDVANARFFNKSLKLV